MSLQKVINFIFWLRKSGFNIGVVSTDQYQSSYVREVLEQQGFETARISVDRSEEPYLALRNLLVDQRVEMIKCQLLEDELVHLQRVGNKIDHPANGDIGKDLADSFCGACYTLLEDAADLPGPIPAKSVAKAIAAVNGLNSRVDAQTKINELFGAPKRTPWVPR